MAVDRALRHGQPHEIIRSYVADHTRFEFLGLLDQDIFSASSRLHFKGIATDYLDNVAKEDHMFSSLIWQLSAFEKLSRLPLFQKRSTEEIYICDLGAGAGAISSWPALAALRKRRQSQARHLLCFDIAPEMRDATRGLQAERMPSRLAELFHPLAPRLIEDIVSEVRSSQYVVSDFTDPGTLSSYRKQHVVICSFTLHHLNLRSKRRIITEICNFLEDDGVLIFVDEYRSFEDNLAYLNQLMENGIPYGLESFLDEQNYAHLFEKSGFIVEERKPIAGGRAMAFAMVKRRTHGG